MPVGLLLFGRITRKIMLVFPNYAPFLKSCSSTMANKSKNTFSLIRSRIFLSAVIYILFHVCLYCGFSCVAIVAGSDPSFLWESYQFSQESAGKADAILSPCLWEVWPTAKILGGITLLGSTHLHTPNWHFPFTRHSETFPFSYMKFLSTESKYLQFLRKNNLEGRE